MATRKQKHEAAAARRAELEAELRESGLKAQQKDREIREARRARAAADAERMNHRHEAILANARLRGEL